MSAGNEYIEQLAGVWRGMLATAGGYLASVELGKFSEIAAILAHVGTAAAGITTAIYTAYWLYKGRRKP